MAEWWRFGILRSWEWVFACGVEWLESLIVWFIFCDICSFWWWLSEYGMMNLLVNEVERWADGGSQQWWRIASTSMWKLSSLAITCCRTLGLLSALMAGVSLGDNSTPFLTSWISANFLSVPLSACKSLNKTCMTKSIIALFRVGNIQEFCTEDICFKGITR